MRRGFLLLALIPGLAGGAAVEPPFSGTIFIDPDIVTASDPSAFQRLEDAGHGTRRMFDRRINDWETLDAFLFNAFFDDGLQIEVQVNPEFQSAEAARQAALGYLPAVGQLPNALRQDVQTIWLHKGHQPFGGGNQNLLIHTEQADEYIASGILEETLMHEACHTSLDAKHASSPGWLSAQSADPVFVSTYARDNPDREDVAETFVPWFAARFRSDRISDSLRTTILDSVPRRAAYFDQQDFNLHPAVLNPIELRVPVWDPAAHTVTFTWSSQAGHRYLLEQSEDLRNWSPAGAEVPSGGRETNLSIGFESLRSTQFFRVRQAP